MFLLFFLMVAAGMLSLLWLYFPLQGSPPPETTPFQAPATVPAATPSGALPQPPEAPVAAVQRIRALRCLRAPRLRPSRTRARARPSRYPGR
jgi:hypothetical protein